MKKTILLSLATVFAVGYSYAQQTPANKPAPAAGTVAPKPVANPGAVQKNPKMAPKPVNAANPAVDPKNPKSPVNVRPGGPVNVQKHPQVGPASSVGQNAQPKHHVVAPPPQQPIGGKGK